MNIKHQFIDSDFFLPNWDIDTLVLGTFNPNCGKKTDYFYGRNSNLFWRAIESICDKAPSSLQDNYSAKNELMVLFKFGCSDIISSVEFNESVRDKICGKGYSDSILFTLKYVAPVYEFEKIKNYLIQHNILKVINTWGKRKSPKNFLLQINDLELFCQANQIDFIRCCPSPSGRLKKNMPELTSFYKKHILQGL
jgi:hypothetical protein